MGRVSRLTDAAGERSLAYDGWGGLAMETYLAGGMFGGWEVKQDRDGTGRLAGVGLGRSGTGVSQHYMSYGYDTAGRVGSVTSAGKSASYAYDPVHLGLEQVALSNGTSPVLYGTFRYDAQRRLERISYHNGQLSGGFELFSDHAYTRDGLGKLLTDTAADRSRELYQYGPSGELVTAKRLENATGTSFLAGHNFEWSYDGIGNRLAAGRGGNAAGSSLRQTGYGPAPANLLASALNPGAVDVSGVASAASVSVNSLPASRQGDFFHRELPADNSTGPVWKQVDVADGTDSESGAILVPPANQGFSYDADGNLEADGTYDYT